MRLDIRYQPLDFDVYLSQRIDFPQSVDSFRYDFSGEEEALNNVNIILETVNKERAQLESSKTQQDEEIPAITPTTAILNHQSSLPAIINPEPFYIAPQPTPQPAESAIDPKSTNIITNLVNPCDFEDSSFNPFDHVELQTIDELRELDLVFQASYANSNEAQNDSSTSAVAKTPFLQ